MLFVSLSCLVFALLTLCKCSFLPNDNGIELVGLYPYGDGAIYDGKNVVYQGEKAGFVEKSVATAEGFALYFRINKKISVSKDSGFYPLSSASGQIFISIRKGIKEEICKEGDAITFIDQQKEMREKNDKSNNADLSPEQIKSQEKVIKSILEMSKSLENAAKWLKDANKTLEKRTSH